MTRYELIKYLADILRWRIEGDDGDSIKFGYKSIDIFPKYMKQCERNKVF